MVQVPQYGGRFGALAAADAMAVSANNRHCLWSEHEFVYFVAML